MQCKACGAACDPSDSYCRNCGLRFARPLPLKDDSGSAGQAPPVRRKGCSALLLAAAVAVVFFALLANVVAQVAPDLLKLVGFKPKDLGVKWTASDYESIVRKCGVTVDAPPEGRDRSAYRLEFSGEQDVDWTFTQSEITAWLNTNRPGYWPFSNMQMKLNAGNIIEASFGLNPAVLMTDKSVEANMPPEVKGYLNNFSMEVPVYAKAKITFTGPKQVNLEVLSFSALGMSMSDFAQGEQVNDILKGIVEANLAEAGPVQVESFTMSDGSLRLKGKWYTDMKRIPVK